MARAHTHTYRTRKKTREKGKMCDFLWVEWNFSEIIHMCSGDIKSNPSANAEATREGRHLNWLHQEYWPYIEMHINQWMQGTEILLRIAYQIIAISRASMKWDRQMGRSAPKNGLKKHVKLMDIIGHRAPNAAFRREKHIDKRQIFLLIDYLYLFCARLCSVWCAAVSFAVCPFACICTAIKHIHSFRLRAFFTPFLHRHRLVTARAAATKHNLHKFRVPISRRWGYAGWRGADRTMHR